MTAEKACKKKTRPKKGNTRKVSVDGPGLCLVLILGELNNDFWTISHLAKVFS